MAQPNLNWTTIRAFTAVAGESTAIPAANTFVTLPGVIRQGGVPRLVEFFMDPVTPSAANTPTAVIIKIYRALVTGDASRHLVATWTIAMTDITNNEIVPIIVEGYCQNYSVRVSFTGGSSPTFTGTVKARALE